MTGSRFQVAWIALLATGAAFLYFHRLGSVPAYLSIEEVSQAREAIGFVVAGPAADGDPLPARAPEDNHTAHDPVWFYLAPVWVLLGAGLLKAVPFSEALVRAPSAWAGVLNVVLIFIAGRELLGGTRSAVIAAGLLMLTPAHFIQSRIASGQIATVTFVLAWLIFMIRYVNTERPRDLSLATLCLGLGMYAYAGGLVIMPVYFLATLCVVRRRRRDTATTGLIAACAGFGVAFVPLAIFHVLHPQHLMGLATYYTHGEYNKNLGWKGFLGVSAVSHIDAWWDCYSPDKLFFSGDSDLRFSTREAGYFLLPAAAPMIAGVWYARRRLKPDVWIVLISGLVLAPLPAALVSSSEIKRWLTFVPFALLAATCGIEYMLADRRRSVRTCAIAVLLLGAFQAVKFFDDYFGRYRDASALNFGGNVRGAIYKALSVSAPSDCVLLGADVYYLRDQWDLYSRAYGRTELATRTTWFGPNDAVQPPLSCSATTVLALADDTRLAGWHSIPVPELNGSVVLAVFRRNAP